MPSALYQPMLEASPSTENVKKQSNGNGIANGGTYDGRSRRSRPLVKNSRNYLPAQMTGNGLSNGGGGMNGGSSGTRKFLVCGALVLLLLVYLVWYARMDLEGNSNYPGKSTASALTSSTDSGSDKHSTTQTDQDEQPQQKRLTSLPNSTMSKTVNETLNVCTEYFVDGREYMQNKAQHAYASLPIIYFVTPTYPRREQVAELTRLAHTLMHVPRLHWILANDHATCSGYLDVLCHKFGIPFTHLASPMPDRFREKKPIPRGVANRRAAINWLQQRNITEGILYFGDDDNTYDLKLFSEIRSTQRVSMLPVGLIAAYSVSGPLVRKGKVVGFLDSWVADRHWPVDMAGFAVNLAYMAKHPNANMPYKAGYEEDYFLRSIGLRLDFIEPKGNNCTEILVWHTQTKSEPRPTVLIKHEYLDDRTNLGALFRSLQVMGVATASDTDGKKAIISKNGKAKDINYFLS